MENYQLMQKNNPTSPTGFDNFPHIYTHNITSDNLFKY